jgi:MFS transporter, DHA2 family, multidrug resistance protein
LQSLFAYDATTSGLVLSPAWVFALAMLLVIGAVLSRGVDARYLMAGGLVTMSLGNYWMAHLNLEISPYQVVWPRVVLIAGLSMMFAPLNVAAFIYLPKEVRGTAVGLLALLRNEGGSAGTSIAQIIQERREQFHTLRLNESLDNLNRPVNNLLSQGQAFSCDIPAMHPCRIKWRWRCSTNPARNRPHRSPILTSFPSPPQSPYCWLFGSC